MYGMSWWLVLRHHGPIHSDRCLYSWEIFSCLSQCLLEMSHRNISSLNWIQHMHDMSRRVILRHHGPIYSDRRLYSWEVFGCLCDCVLEMSHRNISSLNWIQHMHGMSRRIVLRHHRLECSDGRLFSWEVFGWLCERVLELSRWDVSSLF